MPITLTLSDDGPPKRQLIELAFGEIGSAGYEFGRTAEEVTDALTRLNTLMQQWPYNLLGYIQPDYGVGNADEPSGIPFDTMNAVAAALALRIAPVMGATLPPESIANLKSAVSLLHSQYATVPTMPLGRHTPRGAGAQRSFLRSPFINETAEDVNPTEEV